VKAKKKKRRTSQEVENDKRALIQAELDRLEESVRVYQIRDDVYLYTTSESAIPRHSTNREDKGIYWWRVAGIRPVHPEYALYQRAKRFKCQYCNFKSIHALTVDHHETFTHLPKHPTSIYHGKMSERETELWKIVYKRHGGF
jgi:hypothetical protein